ncbi:MAG: thiamine biosynthesis protein ThiS [Moraxellaceae bacterium]|jgi:thiamine biosynthesis protein ThiS|nr:thiamine biosynthesis protein ThiS [Moraxellaceae bacterium]
MNIRLNGEVREVAESMTIAALLAELDLVGQRLAVEINGEIAPRSRHASTALKADDRVEIVQAIGGG